MVSIRKRGKVYEYRFEIALTNIGTISYEVLEGLNYRAARLAQIPDEQYRELVRKYASSNFDNKLSNNKWKKKKWNMVCQCN